MNVDADLFLSKVRGRWNVVLVDLPDPGSIELVKLYSRSFYQKIRNVLSERGVVAIQATSPYHARESFLCIQRTLEAAGLSTIPYHENVPSFGEWGWLLAWRNQVAVETVQRRIENMVIKAPTRYLTPDLFRSTLVFGKDDLYSSNTDVNTLMFPVLLNYYLNESWLAD